MNPCDICLDECPKNGTCDCSKCDHSEVCPKFKGLRPIIRITTKCTQSCSHCCFDCSPKRTDMMSVSMAKNVKTFIDSNEHINFITIMGGEFHCNPDWKEILNILLPNQKARIVSNSDWVGGSDIIKVLSQYPETYLSLSLDRWHTNENVDKAAEILEENGIKFNIATEKEGTDESVVPVGRGEYSNSMYSIFSTYCSNPLRKYSFLIDERGKIYKCGFGVWNYANITDYQEGRFSEKFKEFNLRFYDCFISNCQRCQMQYKFK